MLSPSLHPSHGVLGGKWTECFHCAGSGFGGLTPEGSGAQWGSNTWLCPKALFLPYFGVH